MGQSGDPLPPPQLGHSQPLGCISRLGSLMWSLGPSQQCKEFFDIIVLQFVGCPLSGYRIWFYSDCTPPTVLLWLLLCPWIWGIFQTHSPLRVGPHGQETMLPAHVRGWQLGWWRSHCQAQHPWSVCPVCVSGRVASLLQQEQVCGRSCTWEAPGSRDLVLFCDPR